MRAAWRKWNGTIALDSAHFDIEGKSDGKPGEDQMRRMLQTLLRDRFQLTLHGGTTQLRI
jgi:uncharacterized protein (TIGR03435 family)